MLGNRPPSMDLQESKNKKISTGLPCDYTYWNVESYLNQYNEVRFLVVGQEDIIFQGAVLRLLLLFGDAGIDVLKLLSFLI